MFPFTQRQRRVLIALGLANLIAVITLGLLLLRAPSASDDDRLSSPLNPQYVQACRRAVSRALFEANQNGIVQTRDDGTILIQFDRTVTPDTQRLEADAATWAGMEAVAGQADCLDFSAVLVTAVLSNPLTDADPASSQALRATARVEMADLMLWALGEIDDAELSLRLDYQPPAPPQPEALIMTANP